MSSSVQAAIFGKFVSLESKILSEKKFQLVEKYDVISIHLSLLW
jgi:hypothetical protein